MLMPIHASLLACGYARTRKWLQRLSNAPHPRQPTPVDIAYARRLVELASIAGRHGLVNASCLRQSLLIYFLLRRRGLSPVMVLGVRRQESNFDAHAWVELGELALGQAGLAHTALPSNELQRQPR